MRHRLPPNPRRESSRAYIREWRLGGIGAAWASRVQPADNRRRSSILDSAARELDRQQRRAARRTRCAARRRRCASRLRRSGLLAGISTVEIYNRQEAVPAARLSLLDAGHRFPSSCWLHMNGGVCRLCRQDQRRLGPFSSLTSKRGKLVGSRDRLGTRPLYYGEKAGSLILADHPQACRARALPQPGG